MVTISVPLTKSKVDNYPIPKTEDLLATLGGGNKFNKLDMSQAYQQFLLDEESKNSLQSTLTRDSINKIDCTLGLRQRPEFSSVQWKIYCKASPMLSCELMTS